MNTNNNIICSNCGNSSIDVYLCNQCALQIRLTSTAKKSLEDIRVEDNFLEHIISEFNLKIDYPADWTKTERNQINSPNTSILAIFRPQETDLSFKDQAIAIGLRYVPLSATLKDFLESYIQGLKQRHSDFKIVDSFPISIAYGKIQGYQITYTETQFKVLFVSGIKVDRAYYIIYRSKSEHYYQFLSVAERMILSNVSERSGSKNCVKFDSQTTGSQNYVALCQYCPKDAAGGIGLLRVVILLRSILFKNIFIVLSLSDGVRTSHYSSVSMLKEHADGFPASKSIGEELP